MKLKACTLKQLHDAMLQDMQSCQTALERSMCEAFTRIEMKELKQSLTRKLTPCEVVICEKMEI
jgi:hypothetical protein